MISGVTLTLLTGVLWTLVGIVYSKAAESPKGFSTFMFVNSAVFALISWGISTPPATSPQEISKVAAVILPAALFGQAGFLTLFHAMRSGPHGVAWGIAQAAMLLPFLAGWLWFGNPAGIWQIAGMILLSGALILLAAGKSSSATRRTKAFAGLCIASLILIGVSQAFTLLPNRMGLSDAALNWRVPLYSLGGLWWFVPLLLKEKTIDKSKLKTGILYGGIVAAGQIALYFAIDAMSLVRASQLVYPIAIGTCIVCFFLFCRFFRKEKSTPGEIAGIGLLTAGLLLITA